MPVERLGGSFRDPSGFVFTRDGVLLRQINEIHREQWDRFLSSGLHDVLVERGLMVSSEEVSVDLAAAPGAYKVVRPEPIPFISYPYEWSFGQLKAAALATLEGTLAWPWYQRTWKRLPGRRRRSARANASS